MDMVKYEEQKKRIMDYCRLYVVMKSPKPVSVSEMYNLILDKRLGVSNVLNSRKQLSSMLTTKWQTNNDFKKSYGKGGAVYWECTR